MTKIKPWLFGLSRLEELCDLPGFGYHRFKERHVDEIVKRGLFFLVLLQFIPDVLSQGIQSWINGR